MTDADAAPTDERVYAEISSEPLDTGAMMAWATTPDSGAVVTFVGVVRDHAEGRDDVVALTYEAYEEPGVRALRDVATAALRRWPDVRRVCLVHRVGRLELSAAAVAVVVSSPHRADAFEAARYCIDTVKQTVPIWKKEHWRAGADWGTDAEPIRAVEVPVEEAS